jgi:hypothetical protein
MGVNFSGTEKKQKIQSAEPTNIGDNNTPVKVENT